MSAFKTSWHVRFADTDPAGIVFYPRYFEMVNGVVENWCAEALEWSFKEQLIDSKVGLPTVHLEADFINPSFLGDDLDITLQILTLGRTSCTLSITASCKGEKRFVVRPVLVLIDTIKYKAQAFPDHIREKMLPFLVDHDDD